MINLREKLEEIRTKRDISRAKGLEQLRIRREKEEGRARLIKIENREKKRILEAKQTIRENNFLYKVGTQIKKHKGKLKGKGLSIGGRKDFYK